MTDALLHFFIERADTVKKSKVRDLRVLAKAHLKGRFFFDLFTSFPFAQLFKASGMSTLSYRLSFLVKILRLEKAFMMFNTTSFRKCLK
mmetsp:Transcript_33579/g.51652  ORF Transcript_33579/g.51652 Transcript_33579/m.51652 type:complete len:89 (+) Transcript_33579:1014-1280(+)